MDLQTLFGADRKFCPLVWRSVFLFIWELLSSSRVISLEWIFDYVICCTYHINHCIIYIIGLIIGPHHDFVPLKQHEIVAMLVVVVIPWRDHEAFYIIITNEYIFASTNLEGDCDFGCAIYATGTDTQQAHPGIQSII